MPKISFDDYIGIIDVELTKRRSKWQLYAINWISYEDVEQIIRLHIFKKFHFLLLRFAVIVTTI